MTTYSPGLTGSITVTVNRYGAATLNRGQFTATTTPIVITDANIQPASKEDILRLPEGKRHKDVQIIFTATELFSAGNGGTSKGDRVEYDGREYEVFFTNTYRMGVLDHTEAIMVEVTDA